jgi:hypothetical protein
MIDIRGVDALVIQDELRRLRQMARYGEDIDAAVLAFYAEVVVTRIGLHAHAKEYLVDAYQAIRASWGDDDERIVYE